MSKPNILFLFTDDQRFDTIHALGNERIVTPNMDALVRNGVTFSNAHIMGGTSGAVCMPSRAMLMTGRTLFHLQGQGDNIPEEHTMLPEALRRAGYTTFSTGKWHNGPSAFARGFGCGDRIFFGGMSDHYKVPLNHFDPDGAYPEDDIYYEDKKHSSDLFSDSAIDFLRGHDPASPFFAYVSFTAPHDPRDTHERFHAMYDSDTILLPESFMPEHPFDNGEMTIRDEELAPWPRTPDVVRQNIAEYYAMITHIDDRIGAILGALEERGLADNTIIVFAGDNGLAVGRHGLMGKQNLYDHSVRVPLVIGGPGIPKDERRDAFCYLLDIFPTLCDLTDTPIPESVEGRSLAPCLEDSGRSVRNSLYLAYTSIHRGVRDDHHKLIEYVVNGSRTTQLFDLESDPFELHNLAERNECADDLTRLRKELVRWRDDLDDHQPGMGQAFWDGCESW
ncbi:MAG: sulfatase-like hydrolase/transferase [bacterium]|nr:sulfatase-like hydrolase/transferase [bacterium]